MIRVNPCGVLMALIGAVMLCDRPARAGDWTPAVEVRHDETLSISYQAKLDGPNLLVRATIEPGWHTFAMDNQVRAEERLAGKPSLGIDRPTKITLSGGLQVAGPWHQTAPLEFSKPELRWFSWGFERQAVFAARVRRSASGTVRIGIRGQACTETICRNIDVTIPLPLAKLNKEAATAADLVLKDLVQVR
jgi:hypothetical protein